MSTSWNNSQRLRAVSSADSDELGADTLARLARNELSAEERARALERVAADPVLAQALRLSCELEPWSQAVAADIEVALAEQRGTAGAGKRSRYGHWRPMLAMAASVMLVAVTLGVWLFAGPMPGSIPGSMNGQPSTAVAGRTDATPSVAARATEPKPLFNGNFEAKPAPEPLFRADFETSERSRVFRADFERDAAG